MTQTPVCQCLHICHFDPLCALGGWKSGSKKEVKRQGRLFARHGFVAFAINYRKAPRHVFPAQINDCHSALSFIRENVARFGVDPTRICAWGYSAGGHLVSLLAAKEHFDKALAYLITHPSYII